MQIAASELKSMIKRVSAAKADQIILTDGGLLAIDQDVAICTSHPAMNGFPVGISINGRKFSSLINRMSGEVSVAVEGPLVTIRSAKVKAELEHKPTPKRQFVKPAVVECVPTGLLKEILKYAASAADPNRAATTGGAIQFQSYDGGDLFEEELQGFEVMGTDDARCAFTKVNVPLKRAFKYSLPLPAVAAIQALDGETVTFGDAGPVYYFHDGRTTIYANKLAKTYPDYRSIVPRSFKFEATIQHTDLKQVLYSVEPMLSEEEKYGISVHFLDGLLTIRTVGIGGRAEDQTTYTSTTATNLTIKLNHRHLSDFVAGVKEPIRFKGNDPQHPILLESGSFNLLVSPVIGGS